MEIVADVVCRHLNHMSDVEKKAMWVELPPEDRDMKLMSWIDPENFNPGYLIRDMHLMPKRGA